MSNEHRALVIRWFEEVWNKKRESAIFEMAGSEVEVHGLAETPDKVLRTPDAFLPFWRSFVAAFPDIQVTVQDMVAEGDKIATRCLVRGTHTGPELGVPPTGATVEFGGICLCQIRNGRIVKAWNYFDFLELQRRIGMIPPIQHAPAAETEPA